MLLKKLFAFGLFIWGSQVWSQGRTTDIDTLLQGREYQLPPLKASLRSQNDPAQMVQKSAKKNESEGLYTLQFDAVADFDAAQKRREDLQRRTGYSIQMVFDAPFYKLRAGSWTTKNAAEDQVRELSIHNISAFVVKLK